MPGPASSLLAQNIVNLLTLAAGEDGSWAPDFEDEIIAGACVTHDGQIRHEPTRDALAERRSPSGSAPEKPSPEQPAAEAPAAQETADQETDGAES
jgi:NAD(P) transhydrogenase subunit alpha